MGSATKAKNKGKSDDLGATGLPRAWAELLGVLLLGIALFVGGALFSHQFGNGALMGGIGKAVAGLFYQSIGMTAYLVVVGVLAMAIKAILGHRMELRWGEALGFGSATLAACVLLALTFPRYRLDGVTAGGLIGEFIADIGQHELGTAGAYVAAITILGLGLVASTPFSARQVLLATAAGIRWLTKSMGQWLALAQRSWSAAGDRNLPTTSAQGQRDMAVVVPKKSKGKASAEPTSDDESDEEWEEEEWEEDEEWAEECEDEEDTASEQVVQAPPTKAPRAARPNRKREATQGAVEGGEVPAERSLLTVAARAPEIIVPDEDELVEAATVAAARRRKPEAAEGTVVQPSGRPVLSAARPSTVDKPERGGVMPVQYLTDSYELPPIHLFEAVEKSKVKVDREFVLAQSEQIEQTLAHFKIGGKVAKIHPGPVVTRYEFKPEAGVKLSRIETLENDLAMALEAVRIRILAPIPGSSSVGFEVPNKVRETVYVQEVLADPSFTEGGSAKLPLVLGKNITGKPVSLDLGKAPHLLVAGATGSGKSVGVNCMLCSLLYSCTPEDLRLILIDPKMLEFSVYADIPHLLLPVITDAEKANLALRWTVNEMERRYAVLSDAKVRDLAGYNKKLPELQEAWEGEKRALEQVANEARQAVRDDHDEEAVVGSALDGIGFDEKGYAVDVFGGKPLEPRPEKIPYVVVFIDEFADLMMVASKEVEANVARIAAKARAAGIHLVVATQRPSVDVITGTIKNNFPSRIAFQVTSDVDSRTILDQKGAKQLLGMGDMLYMDRGKEPVRVHGCFVSEHEIEKVVEFARKQAKPAYNLEITRAPDNDGEAEEEQRAQDPLYDRAVQIVAETQKVSTSMIQRRLNIGYNRAAKIVEAMEAQGIIGPARGVAPREVLISPM